MFLYNNLAVVGKRIPPPPPKICTSSFLEPVDVTLHVKKDFIDAMKLRILRGREIKKKFNLDTELYLQISRLMAFHYIK